MRLLDFILKPQNKETISPAKELLKKLDTALIVQTISEVESNTTAELRIHIEDTTHNQEVYARAKQCFKQLGMTQTTERNGVLIYIAVADHKLAILGDKGIYEKINPNYWVEIKDNLIKSFKKEEYTQGIVEAIKKIGKILSEYFPNTTGNKRDELSNEISIG
ncbi:MAG: TPM domain-containing protein [Bacteroidia bacterium]|nr:TPM domain-containing protein [Bacteroidia bacterium]MDW8348260.1 TPM domain-containing protein [Bacteroidia bacterium]